MLTVELIDQMRKQIRAGQGDYLVAVDMLCEIAKAAVLDEHERAALVRYDEAEATYSDIVNDPEHEGNYATQSSAYEEWEDVQTDLVDTFAEAVRRLSTIV